MEKFNENLNFFLTIDSYCCLRRMLFLILSKFSRFRGGGERRSRCSPWQRTWYSIIMLKIPEA